MSLQSPQCDLGQPHQGHQEYGMLTPRDRLRLGCWKPQRSSTVFSLTGEHPPHSPTLQSLLDISFSGWGVVTSSEPGTLLGHHEQTDLLLVDGVANLFLYLRFKCELAVHRCLSALLVCNLPGLISRCLHWGDFFPHLRTLPPHRWRNLFRAHAW